VKRRAIGPKPWTQAQLDAWNMAHPVGTKCQVRQTEFDPWEPTETTSQAWLLGHGEPVVKVACLSGGYGLNFLRFPGGAK